MKIIKPLKICTISFSFQTNIDFSSTDLLTLALYLKCDERILGIFLNYLRDTKIIKKGFDKKEPKKTSVYNQISLLLKINDKDERKVKLFTGGKMIVCGCKHDNDVQEVYDTFISILNDFKVNENVEIYPVGSLIVDKNNIIFNTKQKIIGLIDNKSKVYLKGEHVLPVLHNDIECWITSKFNSEKRKNIYDSDGEIISYINKPKKKDEEITVYLKESDINLDKIEDKIYFDFKDKISSAKLDNIKIVLFNQTYKMDIIIDKRKLNDILNKKGYHTSYNDEIFANLKLFYYFGENSLNGKCDCKNNKLNDKILCTCEKETAIIAGNGTVMLYGFKSKKHLIVHDFINNFIDSYM